jgi:GNAT superfamily N-acetyltransferase
MNTPLIIRTAIAADRDAVFAFTDRIWGGEDYIRYVWDEWLEGTGGPFITGVIEDSPVALAKLSDMGKQQLWLRGLRVSDEVRGRGYARQMTQWCLDYARRHDFHVVRYMTDLDNAPMNHLADSLGFTLLVSPTWFRGPVQGDPWELRTISQENIQWLETEITATRSMRGMEQYYCGPWCVQITDRESLEGHLRAGEVWAIPQTNTWAIVIAEHDYIWLASAGGNHADLVRLLRQLPSHPARTGKAELLSLVIAGTELADALIAAGYRQEDGRENIYELRL